VNSWSVKSAGSVSNRILPEREPQLRYRHGQDVPRAVVQAIGDLEAVQDVLLGGPVLPELDAREPPRTERHEPVHVFEVASREQRLADPLERPPVLEVRVETRCAEQARARLRPVGRVSRQLEERVARLGALLHPLECEPQVEPVLGRVRSVRHACEERPVRLRRVTPPLLHEASLAALFELVLRRDLRRSHDPRLCVDVGGRPGGEGTRCRGARR
jgi:hypothetical protein